MKKGFTLVELLIAMTIVVILSAMGLSIYSSIQKGGRDAKRKSDLAVIQSALEQYHADQFYYPASLTFGGSISFTGVSVTKTYLAVISSDPDYS